MRSFRMCKQVPAPPGGIVMDMWLCWAHHTFYGRGGGGAEDGNKPQFPIIAMAAWSFSLSRVLRQDRVNKSFMVIMNKVNMGFLYKPQ
ncbi:hypothetical protein AVEN_269328-1 [Araneus ventricosus]|uniref:Uncharacterized protein n=1 Tax=Araneus ventricosus TaxID=182803 RepID=A0A4Y2TRP4_ARAVE|nr:hypothetical protein AVEN_269328-1 [Araneus ventricosus]